MAKSVIYKKKGIKVKQFKEEFNARERLVILIISILMSVAGVAMVILS